jgi:hypothetical protein
VVQNIPSFVVVYPLILKRNLPIPHEKSYNCSAIPFYWTFGKTSENIETLSRGTYLDGGPGSKFRATNLDSFEAN